MSNVALIELRAYLSVQCFALCTSLVLYWLLAQPLSHFLRVIFAHAGVEQFWRRVVLWVLIASSLSHSLPYRPTDDIATNYIALVWHVADALKATLDGLLWGVFGVFLPLLLSYTVLHAGRRRPADDRAPVVER